MLVFFHDIHLMDSKYPPQRWKERERRRDRKDQLLERSFFLDFVLESFHYTWQESQAQIFAQLLFASAQNLNQPNW